MNKMYSEFNKMNASYSYLLFKGVEIDCEALTIRVELVCPNENMSVVRANKSEIYATIKKILDTNFNIELKFVSGTFNAKTLKNFIWNYISTDNYISNIIDSSFISVTKEGDNPIVEITITRSAYSYAEKSLFKNLNEALKNSFNYNVNFKFNLVDNLYNARNDYSSRIIVPENVTAYIGKIVLDPCGYLSDLLPTRNTPACGVIEAFNALKSKGSDKKPVRDYFKFNLRDFSGMIECMAFPKGEQVALYNADALEGRGVVVYGDYVEESGGRKKMMVRRISYCTVPKEAVYKAAPIPDRYMLIFPEPYVEEVQTTIDDLSKSDDNVPTLLKGTVVVFDFETTGKYEYDMITEIGAVKLVDGKMTETFSTYVNPHRSISAYITNLTSISDETVKNAPDINDVLPDFYKFTENCVMVAHNYGFDSGFLNRAASALNFVFPTKYYDTMVLARKTIESLNNLSLGSIASKLNIVNKNAHRALSDAVTTARILIHCAKEADKLGIAESLMK